MGMYTLLYLKWITNKDLLHVELCSMLCVSLGEGSLGEEWIQACVWLNPSLFTRNYHNIVNQLYTNTK